MVVLLAIPLILIFSTKLFSGSQKGRNIQDTYISPSKGHLLLFKITKKNYKFQVLYGILIFLLVLVPINCLFFIFIPQMVEFQTISNSIKFPNYYLVENNYFIFLLSAIVIQICIAITEETISKGFILKRGSEYYGKLSAVFITSLFLGFSQFIFYLEPLRLFYPSWFPLIWFFKSFITGIILSLFVLRKNWLFPVIFANALNNIILTHLSWFYLPSSENFLLISLYIYLPLLIISVYVASVIVFIWKFPRIKKTLQSGVKELKMYFKNDKGIKESNGDKYFRIFIDIIISGFFFLMSILILV